MKSNKLGFFVLSLVAMLVFFSGCVSENKEAQTTTTTALITTTTENLPAVTTTAEVEITTTTIALTTTTTTIQKKEMKRGTVDLDFSVTIYDEEKAYDGTTLLSDNHRIERPRVIEVNMLGEIIWEYDLPADMKAYTNPGFDVEPLQNGNVLITLPRKGVFEINKAGKIVWQYLDAKVSHDADRLSNGNTLIAFGNEDTKEDSQAKEVDKNGKIVWSWKAKDYFGNNESYSTIYNQGWTHTNSVTRLENGDTLISLRNFNLIAEVNSEGEIVKEITNSEFEKQHDPLVLSNGRILLANHATPNSVFEIDENNKIVWKYVIKNKDASPVRDANRLPNGNTLITGTDRIFEITSNGTIVWMFQQTAVKFTKETAPMLGFYKAERIGSQ